MGRLQACETPSSCSLKALRFENDVGRAGHQCRPSATTWHCKGSSCPSRAEATMRITFPQDSHKKACEYQLSAAQSCYLLLAPPIRALKVLLHTLDSRRHYSSLGV